MRVFPRVDRCGLCGDVVPVTGLVYRTVVFKTQRKSNFLSSSFPYVNGPWVVSAWSPFRAWGMFPDRRRGSVNEQNKVDVIDGIDCISPGIGVGANTITESPVPAGDYLATVRVAVHEQAENQKISNLTLSVNSGQLELLRIVSEFSLGWKRLSGEFSLSSDSILNFEIRGDFEAPWYFEDARISEKFMTVFDGAVENRNGPVRQGESVKSYDLLPLCGRCRMIDPESPSSAPNPDFDGGEPIEVEIAMEDENV